MNPISRRILWAAWAIVPVAAFALHMGAGQSLLARDRAGSHLSLALAAEQAEDYAAAAEEYALAKNELPEIAVAERARLSLSEARARVFSGGLIEGANQLETLIAEQQALPAPDTKLINEARDALGTAAYFTAWQMRLEGAAPDEWKPETEKARQQFRLLAETALANGDKELADAATQNDELVIRLERMDLSELQGLPLPKKCCKCSGLCQKKRGQRLSKCKSPPKDARDEIKTNSAGQAKTREKGS